jgi:hypothetical protein
MTIKSLTTITCPDILTFVVYSGDLRPDPDLTFHIVYQRHRVLKTKAVQLDYGLR